MGVPVECDLVNDLVDPPVVLPVVLLPLLLPVVLLVTLLVSLLVLLPVRLSVELLFELPGDLGALGLETADVELEAMVVGRPTLLRLTIGGIEVTIEGCDVTNDGCEVTRVGSVAIANDAEIAAASEEVNMAEDCNARPALSKLEVEDSKEWTLIEDKWENVRSAIGKSFELLPELARITAADVAVDESGGSDESATFDAGA